MTQPTRTFTERRHPLRTIAAVFLLPFSYLFHSTHISRLGRLFLIQAQRNLSDAPIQDPIHFILDFPCFSDYALMFTFLYCCSLRNIKNLYKKRPVASQNHHPASFPSLSCALKIYSHKAVWSSPYLSLSLYCCLALGTLTLTRLSQTAHSDSRHLTGHQRPSSLTSYARLKRQQFPPDMGKHPRLLSQSQRL